MNRGYFIEKIWYEPYLPIFLEKFVLPILAAVVVAVILINPLKWDWQQRGSLFIAVLSLAYFFAYSLHKSTPNPAGETPVAPMIKQDSQDSNCSNVIAGRDATLNCPPPSENKNAPKQPPTQKP
jgi:hypothetical protein